MSARRAGDVRDARREDAPALARLLGELGYPAPADAVAARVDRLLANTADRLVVAEAGGEVVGLAGFHESLALEYDAPVAKLSALAVAGSHRRRGIGEALVGEVEAEARARGCCSCS